MRSASPLDGGVDAAPACSSWCAPEAWVHSAASRIFTRCWSGRCPACRTRSSRSSIARMISWLLSTCWVGHFGDGVFVGPLSAATGLELDVVYLLGLSEDLYPGRLTIDTLLPERARQASLGELPSARERLHNQQRDLLAAMGDGTPSRVHRASTICPEPFRRVPSTLVRRRHQPDRSRRARGRPHRRP